MILVTVGNHTAGFERLIQIMDNLAISIDEEIIAQIGHTQYTPKNLKWFRFINYEEMVSLVKNARIIVCHGGAGTIIDATKYGKPLIILPRLHKYGEAFDDHELELAEALDTNHKAILIRNNRELSNAIEYATSLDTKKSDNQIDLTRFLSTLIAQVEK